MTLRPDEFFQRLRDMRGPSPFESDKPRELVRAQQTVKDALSHILNTEQIPFKIKSNELTVLERERDIGGCSQMRVALRLCEGLTCPMYILTPAGTPRFSAFLYLDRGYPDSIPPDVSRALECGVIVVIPDMAGFGALRLDGGAYDGAPQSACYSMTSRLLEYGLSMTGLRVYQCMRIFDAMQHHPSFDPQRMGIMGSGALAQTALLTAALDSRAKAAIIKNLPGVPGADEIIPSLDAAGDITDAAALIAPRPLYLHGGAEIGRMAQRLEHVYTLFSVSERLVRDENGVKMQDFISKWF